MGTLGETGRVAEKNVELNKNQKKKKQFKKKKKKDSLDLNDNQKKKKMLSKCSLPACYPRTSGGRKR